MITEWTMSSLHWQDILASTHGEVRLWTLRYVDTEAEGDEIVISMPSEVICSWLDNLQRHALMILSTDTWDWDEYMPEDPDDDDDDDGEPIPVVNVKYETHPPVRLVLAA